MTLRSAWTTFHFSHDDIPSHADKLGIFELDEVGPETDGQTDENDDSGGDVDSNGCDNVLDARWLALPARDRARWSSYDVWRAANASLKMMLKLLRKTLRADHRDDVVPLVNGRHYCCKDTPVAYSCSLRQKSIRG